MWFLGWCTYMGAVLIVMKYADKPTHQHVFIDKQRGCLFLPVKSQVYTDTDGVWVSLISLSGMDLSVLSCFSFVFVV